MALGNETIDMSSVIVCRKVELGLGLQDSWLEL